MQNQYSLYKCTKIKMVALIFVMTFFQSNVFGQTPKIEKLKKELKNVTGKYEVDKLNNLGLAVVGFNQDEALTYFLRAEEKAEKLRYIKGNATAKRYIGQSYILRNDFVKAKSYYNKSLALFRNLKDDANTADLMWGLAVIQEQVSKDYEHNKLQAQKVIDFCKEKKQHSTLISAYILAGDIEYAAYHNSEAIDYYLYAVGLAKENKKENKKELITKLSALSKLASLYHDIGDDKKAYTYQLKTVNLAREIKSPELPVHLINLGQTLDGLKSVDEAENLYREALKLSLKNNNQYFIALSSENLGRNLVNKKKFVQARPLLENCIEIYRKARNTEKIVSVLELLGNTFLNVGELEKAKATINEGLALTKQQKFKASLFLLKSQLLEKQHDLEGAFTSYKIHILYKDSLEILTNKRITEELLLKYDTQLKESQNKILKNDLKLKELKLASQKSKLIYLIVGLLLLSIAVILLYILFKSKRKTSQILAIQKKQLAINNEQLNESIITKDKFFSILSHDLRDPVISIQSFSRMMATKYDLFTEEERRELIEESVQSANSLFNLLEDLLLWARCQSGSIYPIYERFDLFECMNETMIFYKAIAEQKNVLLKLSCPEDVLISTDKNMLSTITRNLISNAIKFSHTESEIHIECVLIETQLKLTIKDQGVGMSDNEINKLFNITSSFSKDGTANERGNGLGLIICYEFVKSLEGEILVESKREKGTSFIVKLPVTLIVL